MKSGKDIVNIFCFLLATSFSSGFLLNKRRYKIQMQSSVTEALNIGAVEKREELPNFLSFHLVKFLCNGIPTILSFSWLSREIPLPLHHLTCGISCLLHSVNLTLFTVLLVHLILRISPYRSNHLCSNHLSPIALSLQT